MDCTDDSESTPFVSGRYRVRWRVARGCVSLLLHVPPGLVGFVSRRGRPLFGRVFRGVFREQRLADCGSHVVGDFLMVNALYVVLAIWFAELLWFGWQIRALTPVAFAAVSRRIRRWRGEYDSLD